VKANERLKKLLEVFEIMIKYVGNGEYYALILLIEFRFHLMECLAYKNKLLFHWGTNAKEKSVITS